MSRLFFMKGREKLKISDSQSLSKVELDRLLERFPPDGVDQPSFLSSFDDVRKGRVGRSF